jgi:hypothetical protein
MIMSYYVMLFFASVRSIRDDDKRNEIVPTMSVGGAPRKKNLDAALSAFHRKISNNYQGSSKNNR